MVVVEEWRSCRVEIRLMWGSGMWWPLNLEANISVRLGKRVRRGINLVGPNETHTFED